VRKSVIAFVIAAFGLPSTAGAGQALEVWSVDPLVKVFRDAVPSGDAAARLAAKHVIDFDRYNCDVAAFRATRRELLELLSAP